MRTRRSQPSFTASAQAGFSLIEIILVVVLIGGILAFAGSRILGGGDRAKVNLAKAQVQTLAEKVQQYAQDTGGLPGSLDDLVKSSATGWLGPMMVNWGTKLTHSQQGGFATVTILLGVGLVGLMFVRGGGRKIAG